MALTDDKGVILRAAAEHRPPDHPPARPMTAAEFVATMTHFHRAEVARMAGWRDRIDRTTNWAITVVAALLSVSLSTPTAHHGVLLFGMVLVFLLLWIEARRYQFFDVYRERVRLIERCYFAEIFAPGAGPAPVHNWLALLAASLRAPSFQLSRFTAFGRRLKRNYIYMFAVLLAAWVLKIATPRLQDENTARQVVWSPLEAVRNAAFGPLPGWLIVTLVALFYAGLLVAFVLPAQKKGELAHGSVHV